MMKLMMVVAVSSLALLGCKENHASAQEQTVVSPEPKPVEKPSKVATPKWKEQALKSVAKVTELKDAMCKCRDLECATKVMEAQAEWTSESSSGHDPDYGAAERAEVEKMLDPVLKAYTKCMTAALTPTESAPPSKLNGAQQNAIDDLAKVSVLKDEMCKCRRGDKTCVRAVMKASKQWGESLSRPTSDGTKLTTDEKAQLVAALDPITTAYQKCMDTALATR